MLSRPLPLPTPCRFQIIEAKAWNAKYEYVHYACSPNQCVKSLGVQIDSDASMKKMALNCVSNCYFNLKKLGGIKRNISIETRLTLIKLYVISRLDYCNALYERRKFYL